MNLDSIDPRNLATRWPRATVLLFALVTLFMAYANTQAKKGGVLDDAILDDSDPFRVSDQYVRGKRGEGFQGQEFIPFILKFEDGIRTPQDLIRIRDFTNRAIDFFGPAVLSLSEVPDYRDTGEELLNEPHIPERIGDDFSIEDWKRRVAGDPTVYGIMVGRDFDWAAVVRYLPPDYDEIEEFRATVAFVEQRDIPFWEWLYKTDIDAPEDLGVGSGVMIRGLLDQGLIVDTFKLVTIGILLAMPLFVWSLGSLREALVGVVGVVLLGLLWTRGTIGLFDMLGFAIRERVYTLVAFTNCIVQGVSFVLHKFESFHESYRGDDLRSHWSRSRANDHLIGATGIIAILGFATLYSFEVLSIRELGVLSACAVAYQLVLVLVLVPALHTWVSHGKPYRAPQSAGPAAKRFAALIDRTVEAASALVTRGDARKTAWMAGLLTIGVVVVAGLLIWPGRVLLVQTEPFNFIRGTLVERTGRFLNQPGRCGRDLLQFYAEPAQTVGSDIYEPEFLNQLAALQSEIIERTAVREIASVLNQVRRVSEESFDHPVPQTRQEARAAISIVEADLDTAVARQLFGRGGIRLTSYAESPSSRAAAKVLSDIAEIAEGYPAVRLSSFGKSSMYPQLDVYVGMGKPINLLTSQWLVIVFCWIGVAINNRRRPRDAVAPELRSFWGGVVISVPFFFASGLTALLMMALRIPLDAATAAITSLAINASIDFAIYFADSYQKGLVEAGEHRGAVRYAMRHKGRIVLEDMLLNTVCFFPLIISRFDPLNHTGWMMAVMLLACAFGTLVLMPALFYPVLRLQGATQASVRQAAGVAREDQPVNA